MIGGTINQVPDSGAMAVNAPSPGAISVAGELDEWTFFGRAGESITVVVNPGSGTPAPIPVSPLLSWANVQLLDSANNVLSSAANTASGNAVALSDLTLPADGTYKVRVNAPAGHTASTGNYVVTAWDSTKDVSTLNLGQVANGSISTPYNLDQWNFSAVAGQQVQFDLVNASNSAVTFTVAGPNGPVAGLTNLTADSALVNLPASGAYVLTVNGVNGATGNYAFALKQTTQTDLPLGTTYNGAFAGSGQAQLFKIAVPTTEPIIVRLDDAAAGDQNELYLKLGSAPTRSDFDYRFSATGADQSVLVPAATAGTWYALVYTQSAPAPSTFTLNAASSSVFVTGATPDHYAAGNTAIVTLTGAGFDPSTTVKLVDASNHIINPNVTGLDSLTQITATFDLSGVTAGQYSVQVSKAGGTDTLPNAFRVIPGPVAGPIITPVPHLTTSLSVPSVLPRHGTGTIYVTYSNTGDLAMPAPLLVLDCTDPVQHPILTLDQSLLTGGFWTSASPDGFSQEITIFATGKTPGVLQPGESITVPVYYAGLEQPWNFSHNTVPFELRDIEITDTTPLDWNLIKSQTQPTGISTAAWNAVFGNLVADAQPSGSLTHILADLQILNVTPPTANTWGSFVGLLDASAQYLGRLGETVTDVGKLWGFAVEQANGLSPVPTLASAVDASVPTSGLSLDFGRSFGESIISRYTPGALGYGWSVPWQISATPLFDGTIAVKGLQGSEVHYQPDSRHPGAYFSQTGDASVFTKNGDNTYTLTDPNGVVTHFRTDGKFDFVQDTNGNQVTAGYNGSGKLASLTHSAGQSLTIGYNGAGLISSVIDSVGRQTTYSYDDANQHLLSATTPAGTTTYSYGTGAAFHALASITFPDGTHEVLSYDSKGHLSGISRDGNTEPVTFTYELGKVTATDALSHTTASFFNDFGLVAKTQDGLGNLTTFTYDPKTFQVSKITDSIGQTQSFQYDSKGNLLTSVDQLGHQTNFTYGANSRLTSFIDANGNKTAYNYDTHGNLLSTNYADNSQERTTTFDPQGNPLSFVNRNGQPINLTWNTSGQVTREDFPGGSHYDYTYDAHGNLWTATDSGGTTTFTYNAADQLTRVDYPGGTFLKFALDSAGRRMEMEDQTGFKTGYHYDSVGRLASLTDTVGATIVTYSYDPAGHLVRKDNGNDTYTTYDYDANGNILHLINHAPGGSVNSHFDYTYDSLSLTRSMATVDGAWTYSYDGTGQLTHAVFASTNAAIANQDLTYNYDALGNRTTTVINGMTTVYTTNNLNQYISIGGVVQIYDKDGNLLSDGANVYTYNSLNDLIGVNGPSGTTSYAYDSLGHRTTSTRNGLETRYLVDPTGIGNVIGEFNGGGSVIAHYTHGLGLTSQVTGSGTYYYDFDVLGSTAGVGNTSGYYVNKYSYNPFGGMLSSTEAVVNSFQFGGQFGAQSSAGNVFLRSRFFFASDGRFLTADKARLFGGDLNLYRFCSNNPIGLIDPTGAASENANSLPGQVDAWGAMVGWASSSFGLAAHSLESIAKELPDLTKGAKLFGGFSNAGGVLGLGFGGFELTGAIYEKSGWSALHAGGSIGLGALGLGVALNVIPVTAPVVWILEGAALLAALSDLSPHLFPDTPIIPVLVGAHGPGSTSATAGSGDPNDLIGPVGFGAANFVAPSNSLLYRIDFENEPSASAPAQQVAVTNQLSASLDWTSFALTDIGFGDQVIPVPANSQYYSATVPMTYNGQTFEVQVEAGIHQATGQVYANFYSIDPNTSLPPSVLTGFLPPEDTTGRGLGHFSYTVKARPTVATGTAIHNVALISFDNQPIIATNQVDPHNPAVGIAASKEAIVTIDSGAPTSGVQALPAASPASFTVNWEGNDDNGGSGIASYDVYVSDNGGSLQLLRENTTDTSAPFAGVHGHTYGFLSVAHDHVGNTQALPTAAQATTTVDAVAPGLASIVSRKVQGAAGAFDVPLALGGPGTIEPRLNGPDTLVFTFSEPIKAAAGTLGAPNFMIGNGAFASASLSGNTLTLSLSGVVDQSVVSVALNALTDLAGNALAGVSTLNIQALYGDVNQSGSVSVSDLQGVKNHLLQPVDATDYLFDVNGSGAIGVSDLQAVKNNLLHSVIPPPAPGSLESAAPLAADTGSLLHSAASPAPFIGPLAVSAYAKSQGNFLRTLHKLQASSVAIPVALLMPSSPALANVLGAKFFAGFPASADAPGSLSGFSAGPSDATDALGLIMAPAGSGDGLLKNLAGIQLKGSRRK